MSAMSVKQVLQATFKSAHMCDSLGAAIMTLRK